MRFALLPRKYVLTILRKNILFSLLFLFKVGNIFAQNYFANADFEAINNCTEFHQDCASEAWFYLKPAVTPLINNYVVPKPFSGKDLLILPVENIYKKTSKKRTFVYTMLCCPLQIGKNYKLSFYINSAGKAFHGIDFYFSDKEYISENFNNDSLTPSIHISTEDISNELAGWNFVETIYKANGKEKFCYVGNLSKSVFDYSPIERMNKEGDIFYFIDDISFKPVITEKLCSQYQLNIESLFAQNLRHTEAALINASQDLIKDTIIVPSVFFETDKATLKPTFKIALNKIIQKITEKNISKIEIEGHTDNTGTAEHNKELSIARAMTIKSFFLEKLPFLQEQITALGRSSEVPIASNKTSEGKAKNRRVQIVLSYTTSKK